MKITDYEQRSLQVGAYLTSQPAKNSLIHAAHESSIATITENEKPVGRIRGCIGGYIEIEDFQTKSTWTIQPADLWCAVQSMINQKEKKSMRYELKIGKFGQYFHDTLEDRDLPLAEVLEILNSNEIANQSMEAEKDQKDQLEKIKFWLGFVLKASSKNSLAFRVRLLVKETLQRRKLEDHINENLGLISKLIEDTINAEPSSLSMGRHFKEAENNDPEKLIV